MLILRRSIGQSLVLLLPAVGIVAACGSSTQKPSGLGTDSGADVQDGGVDGTGSGDGAIADAPTSVDARDSSATADGPGPVYDGPSPEAGSATLEGQQAFVVGSATLFPGMGGGNTDCEGKPIPAGVVPAVTIGLFPKSISASAVCADVDGGVDAGTGQFILLQIATQQWAMGTGTLTQSLAPATYTISNEFEDDEDLCMLQGGGTAILGLGPLGGDSSSIAISGTVMLTSVGAGSVAGTFDVLMGGPYGTTDGSAPLPLSGSFDALPCP
jgi:hypothetical protein